MDVIAALDRAAGVVLRCVVWAVRSVWRLCSALAGAMLPRTVAGARPALAVALFVGALIVLQAVAAQLLASPPR